MIRLALVWILIFFFKVNLTLAGGWQTEKPGKYHPGSEAYKALNFPFGSVVGINEAGDQSFSCVGFFVNRFFVSAKACFDSLIEGYKEIYVAPRLNIKDFNSLDEAFEVKGVHFGEDPLGDEFLDLVYLEFDDVPMTLKREQKVWRNVDPTNFSGELYLSKLGNCQFELSKCESFKKSYDYFFFECINHNNYHHYDVLPWIDAQGTLIGYTIAMVGNTDWQGFGIFRPITDDMIGLFFRNERPASIQQRYMGRFFARTRGLNLLTKCPKQKEIEIEMKVGTSSFLRAFGVKANGLTHIMQLKKGEKVYLKAKLKPGMKARWSKTARKDGYVEIDAFTEDVVDYVVELKCQ